MTTINEAFLKKMRNPLLFKGFLGAKLPLGYMAGLRIDELTVEQCAVSLPYGWRTQNPFQSIYFAAQSMAAELSTGALAMLAIESADQPVSMLVTNMQAEFTKKATMRSVFTCTQGKEVFDAIAHTIETGEGVKLPMKTIGLMEDGTQISEFIFEWSFKRKSRK